MLRVNILYDASSNRTKERFPSLEFNTTSYETSFFGVAAPITMAFLPKAALPTAARLTALPVEIPPRVFRKLRSSE